MPDDPSLAISTGPVTQPERIESLDVLRGFAVLGILVMNVQSFSMIGAAYINPTAYGELTGANLAVWTLSHLLVDMKFMGIFSMLFGAGIMLMTSRRESAGEPSAGLHFRRMGWLLLFGVLHAYLLWYGDILYSYAMCGFIVYWFRRLHPATLILCGIAALAVGSSIALTSHFLIPYWPPEVIEGFQAGWRPNAEIVAEELAIYRGGWVQQLPDRAGSALFFQTYLFLTEFLWRAGGLMLVGMALYMLGVFSARLSSWTYAAMIAAGVLIGLPIVGYGAYRNFSLDWELRSCFFMGFQLNYWGSVLVSLGWIGAVMLMCRSAGFRPIARLLAPAGQMAFTNYILQSVICTTIFYGHGFGRFGKVERVGQIGMVVAVWIVELTLSYVWLQRFRFGPLEWLWRSLTYWRVQPMRRTHESAHAVAPAARP